MTDYRENFIKDLSIKLLKNFESEDAQNIISLVLVEIEKYELTERTTEIELRDNSSEKLLELYTGTLLTEGKSKQTVYGYIRFIKHFLKDVEKPLLEVETFDIRIWLAKMQQKVSLRTCENYRAYLSALYFWLEKEELIKKNPMTKINPIKYVEEVKLSFSDVEIDTLRMTCVKIRDRAMIELLLCSGIRVSELAGLKINDVDFINKSILIREGKGGKQRVVYITDICLIYLQKYIKTRNDSLSYLFITKNKTPMRKDTIENALRTLGQKSNVFNVHPHRFRRTFATNMYKRGMDIRSIQKLMGHSNINTTMVYINATEEKVNAEYRKYA